MAEDSEIKKNSIAIFSYWTSVALFFALAFGLKLYKSTNHLPAPFSEAIKQFAHIDTARVTRSEKNEISNESISNSVFILGNAGKIKEDLLQLFVHEANSFPNRSTAILLGNNISSFGIGDLEKRKFQRKLEKFNVITDALKTTKAKIILIPGHHDWHYGGPQGRERILRQEKIVNEIFGPKSFAPGEACTGPENLFSSGLLDFHVIDIQKFLRPWKIREDPELPPSNCKNNNLSELKAELDNTLSKSNKKHVLLASHALKSIGIRSKLKRCYQNQDLTCEKNKNVRRQLLETLENHQPLVCIGSHDTSLQVLKGDKACKYYLVSGGGSAISNVWPDENTLFAAQSRGFMRIDETKDGKVFLTVVTITQPEYVEKEKVEYFRLEL